MTEEKKDGIVLPEGFSMREDSEEALKQAHRIAEAGRSLYSTGLPILDKYLGGGFGSTEIGEIVLIHAQSKMFKTTLSMQFIKTAIEQGTKVATVILEGGYGRWLKELRSLYYYYSATNYSPEALGYEYFDTTVAPLIKENVFQISNKMLKAGFTTEQLIKWFETRSLEGYKLFLVDPVGYIPSYVPKSSPDRKIPNWQQQEDFMRMLRNFADDTHSTVVCIQHNVKGNEVSYKKIHRDAAIGGSQAFSQSATKVLELRYEYPLKEEDYGRTGKRLSLEMYKATDVPDYLGMPVELEMHFNEPGGPGKCFIMNKYAKGTQPHWLLHYDPSGKEVKDEEGRRLWWGQEKDDMDNLMEGA